jgi:hypothetical protein
MGTKTTHSFLTDLPPEECHRRLVEAADPKEFSLFSLSGNVGKRPFISNLKGSSFELENRRYYRNDFAPVFFGQFAPEGQGTRIHGHFDSSYWSRLFMKCWLAFVALLSIPLMGPTLLQLIKNRAQISGDSWMSIVVPCGLLAWGIILPRLGRLLGRSQERRILEFMQATLAAREAPRMLPIEPE